MTVMVLGFVRCTTYRDECHRMSGGWVMMCMDGVAGGRKSGW